MDTTDHPEEPRARSLPAGPLTLLTALYAVLYLFWERSGLGSPAQRDLISNIGFIPLNLLAAAATFGAARQMLLPGKVRKALTLFIWAYLATLTGNLGMVLSIDELPGEDAEQLKAWLEPIIEAVVAMLW